MIGWFQFQLYLDSLIYFKSYSYTVFYKAFICEVTRNLQLSDVVQLKYNEE